MSGTAAKKKRKQQQDEVSAIGLPKMSDEELAEFQADYDAQQSRHASWDEKESLLLTKTADQISQQFSSKITDGRLSTIVIERAARVMAQLPTGVVRALTKKNRGLAALMGLFLTKYVQVFDRAQFDHLTKLRMIELYSEVYGVQPVLYDLSVTEDYLGPSCYILPIRSWYPQAGKLSVDDSDHNHVETYVSARTVRGWKGQGSWNDKVLDYVLKQAEEKGGTSMAERDNNQQSVRERDTQANVDGGKGDAAGIRLVTRYGQGSAGRWKSFFPDYDNIVGRDIKSRDGHIPIRTKHHIPLIDDIYGLGAFERGKTIQFARDSLVAMYMAGVQMSIFPPRIVKQGKVVMSKLDYTPGATWIETDPDYAHDAIRNYNVSPAGLETFQSTMGWLTGALLDQNGATDTSQTAKSNSDPTAGRTPEALKRQASRESAADAWAVSMMETFLQGLYERMLNLAPLTPKPFTFHIFDEDIQQIDDAGLKDVMEVFDSKKEALVTLGKEKIANTVFRFYLDGGTTQQADQQAEHEIYGDLLEHLVAAPQLITAATTDGYQVHVGEILHQYFVTGGSKDPEKLISKLEPAKGQPAQGQLPAGAPAADAPDMAQIMSGQPAAPAPEPPDPTKDPNHQLIMAALDKLDPNSLRKVLRSAGLPADSMLPIEAEMIKNLSQPSKTDEQGIKEDIATIEVNPSSPYGAAVDPHAHLQGSKDPMIQNAYKAIMATNPGAPMEATEMPAEATEPAQEPAGVA
jgi:hypothetical protein